VEKVTKSLCERQNQGKKTEEGVLTRPRRET